MNAYKFIEQWGLEEARKLIAFAGPFYLKSFTFKNKVIDADQLKQAIDDFELVGNTDLKEIEETMRYLPAGIPNTWEFNEVYKRIEEGLRDE